MRDITPLPDGHDEPTLYEIRIQGHLDDRWAEWFDGLTLTREDDGDTLLTGPVADQAALHGFLRTIRNLGLPLLSIISHGPAPDRPGKGVRSE